jgi:Domain of unknown function (DUF1876)
MRRWTIDIDIDEYALGRRTCAEARLHTGDPTDLRGTGMSWRHPRDPDVPEVGVELAVARALADLAEKLRAAASGDIEGIRPELSRGW